MEQGEQEEQPKRFTRRRRTTLRQLKYVSAVVSGMDRQDAKREAGFARSMTAGEVEKKLPHEAFMVDMEAQGLTIPALVAKLAEGLEATTVERLMHQKTGEVQEFESPDMLTRQKYLDVAIRLMGGYPKPGGDVRAQDQGASINLVQLVQNNVHLDDDQFLEAMQKARLRLYGQQ